jgi:hypothetical protein
MGSGGWGNNYLCSSYPLGIQWSSAGPIAGMDCTLINEPAEPSSTTWGDNYLCLPKSAPILFRWRTNGRYADQAWRCPRFYEPQDPHTWQDNYLCYWGP